MREKQEKDREEERKFHRQKELAKEEREFKLRERERKAQLSEQESKILKKDQIAKSTSLVPKFEETEVEKYFLMFEKVAKSMDWTTDM